MLSINAQCYIYQKNFVTLVKLLLFISMMKHVLVLLKE